jgi:3-phenylpropionate/trans-cinnamate dioxygenase ferredoxin subunit
MKVAAARVDDLDVGQRVIVEVDGRSIGVFNIDGEYVAIRNACPHHGAPLCRGRITGTLMPSAPDEYVYSGRQQILRCPWHGFEFDVRTGASLADPEKLRVKIYRVSIENDEIMVHIE